MKKTFEFMYSDDLEISVLADSSIVSALVYVPFFDEWFDVTERIVKDEKKYARFIAESLGNYTTSPYDDHGSEENGE